MRRLLVILILGMAFPACFGTTITSGPSSPSPSPSPSPAPAPAPAPAPVPAPAPTPAPPANRAPQITSLNISPTFGIGQVTQFSMTASASDPDGDALTFLWDLGDGSSANGPAVAKTYSAGSGVVTIRLSVSDGRALTFQPKATVTDVRQIVIGFMGGAWAGEGVQLGRFTMNLQQNQGRVSGSYSDAMGTGQIDPAQPGSISSSGAIEMRIKQGQFTDWTFRGQMDSTGLRVTGQIFGSGFNGQSFTMDRQR